MCTVSCDFLPHDSSGAAMSQFSTMTTRERKMQAAAICREVQTLEGSCIISPSLPCFSDLSDLPLSLSSLLFPSHLVSPSSLLAPFTPSHSLLITHINLDTDLTPSLTVRTWISDTHFYSKHWLTLPSTHMHWTVPHSLYRWAIRGSCQPSLLWRWL